MKKLIAVVMMMVIMAMVTAIAEDYCDYDWYTTPVLVNEDGTYSCTEYIGTHWRICCTAEKYETTEGNIRIICDGTIVADRHVDLDNDDDYEWYEGIYEFIEDHLEGCEFIQLGA